MVDFVLYGLDENGETVSTEHLQMAERSDLTEIAHRRLAKFQAVEIWQGPLCVLRLRRKSEQEA